MKNNSKHNIFIIILVILIVGIIYLLFKQNDMNEGFETDQKTKNDTSYLYPIKKLQPICKEQGFKASYMPKACYVDGVLNSYANCKCEDDKGNCKICYPTIEKDNKNAEVIYAPNWS